MTAGYSGTPLPAKLGVQPDSRVLLVNAPEGFDLGVPAHHRPSAAAYDVVLLFCPDVATLYRRFPTAADRHTPSGALWVCWPKKASGIMTDLTDAEVRAYGLAHDRVDVKVAAIDATWSGLKFVIRRADR